MNEPMDPKPFRLTVSMPPHVRDMLDELCDRSGLDRPAALAVIIQMIYHDPRPPFTPRSQGGGE